MTSENVTLGKRIMQLRKASGMTQEQLAEKLGVSPQAVSKWENDVSCPDISTIPLIASIFGVSTDELLGIKEATIRPAAEQDNTKMRSVSRKDIGFGILLIVLGVAFFVSKTVDMPFSLWAILWPAVLFGLGLAWAIEHRSISCLGIAAVGLAFLLSALGQPLPSWIGWSTALPLALILIGLDIVLHRLFPAIFCHREERHPNSHRFDGHRVDKYDLQNGFISCETAFGEEHHIEESGEIKGGRFSTAFGQCTIDLSLCTILPDADITAEVSFGSIELILPRSVRAVPNTTNSFGSTDIHGDAAPDAISLPIFGKVSFGSIEISYK